MPACSALPFPSLCTPRLSFAIATMPVPGLPFTDGQLFQLTNAVLPAWVGLLLVPRLGVPLATAVSCLMSALYIATLIGTFAGGHSPPPPPLLPLCHRHHLTCCAMSPLRPCRRWLGTTALGVTASENQCAL